MEELSHVLTQFILFPVFMFVDWVILHWYACGADGQSLARSLFVRSRDYQIFSDG